MKVLYVDDEPARLRGFLDVAAGRGHLCAFASCAKQALARAERIAPDVAYLKIELPDMSGFELARRLRLRDARMLVAFVGTSGSDAMLAYNSGAMDFLVEPYEEKRLLQSLNKARDLFSRRPPRKRTDAL